MVAFLLNSSSTHISPIDTKIKLIVLNIYNKYLKRHNKMYNLCVIGTIYIYVFSYRYIVNWRINFNSHITLTNKYTNTKCSDISVVVVAVAGVTCVSHTSNIITYKR